MAAPQEAEAAKARLALAGSGGQKRALPAAKAAALGHDSTAELQATAAEAQLRPRPQKRLRHQQQQEGEGDEWEQEPRAASSDESELQGTTSCTTTSCTTPTEPSLCSFPSSGQTGGLPASGTAGMPRQQVQPPGYALRPRAAQATRSTRDAHGTAARLLRSRDTRLHIDAPDGRGVDAADSEAVCETCAAVVQQLLEDNVVEDYFAGGSRTEQGTLLGLLGRALPSCGHCWPGWG